MAKLRKIRNLKSEENTGFGVNSNQNSGRFFNQSTRSANVGKRGVSIMDRYSWYHTMLGMKRGKFLFLLLLSYVSINLIFALAYYMIGVGHLAGIERTHDLKEFSEVFFFSTQTFTTVGYGRISPTGTATSAVSTLEAFLGLLSFAIATGLFYGRFSRPQAFIQFSKNALVSPYKDGIALMFRLAPYKNNNLSEAEVQLTLAMRIEEDGKMVNKFYGLDLVLSSINSVSLSWTLVHVIDDKSPLFGFSENDIKNTEMELLVFVKAFDEIFSNTVVARWSYISDEIIWGAKFKIMFYPSEDKSRTILDLSRIDEYDRMPLPEPNIAALISS